MLIKTIKQFLIIPKIFYKKYSYSVRFSPYIILLSCEMQLTLVFWLRYKGTTRTIC